VTVSTAAQLFGSAELRARAKTQPQGITLGDLLDLELPERRVLLSPWLRTGESAMVWAPTGIGKSWFALSVALAVAGGGEVLGWKASAPARVLYIDGEMNAAEVQDRMRLLMMGAVEGLDPAAARRNLVIQCRQQQELTVAFWDMLNSVDHDALIAELTRRRFDLVLFDNFTTLSDSLADENSAGAMKPALTLLLRLKAAQIGTVLVHHANKAGDNYRGSTAIAATFEVILGLRGTDDPREDRRNSAGFIIEPDKYRARRDDTMGKRKVFLVGDRWETDGLEDVQAERVVAAVRQRLYTSQAEVAEAIGLSPATVSRAMRRAIALAMITEREREDCFKAAAVLREEDPEGDLGEPVNPDF